MNVASIRAGPALAEQHDTRLRGPRLAMVRVVWVMLFLLNLGWFVMALVSQVAAVEHPCVDPYCLVTPMQAESLRHAGIGLSTFAAYYTGVPALLVLTGSFIAILLFWRRPDDWIALAVGLFLVVSPVATFSFNPSPQGLPALGLLLDVPDIVIYYGVFLIFPDGRFVPRWSWLLLVAWVAWHWAVVIATVLGVQAPLWSALGYPVLYLSALATQGHRFRRVSNRHQRQQTKWVILGFAVALLANIMFWIVLPTVVPVFQQPDTAYYAVAFPLYELATIALPVSFAVAIQRDQLFDVDVLINRTLVYGSLSAILAVVYFAVVVAMQQVASAVAGPQATQNPLILVLSTLLIAALFTPLRARIQRFIDRRCYRAKYDAARTLEQFAATLRSDIDLAQLREHLVGVVEEAMQPAHVSLWLAQESAAKPPSEARP